MDAQVAATGQSSQARVLAEFAAAAVARCRMGDRAMSAADITAKYHASASLAFSRAQVDRLQRVVVQPEDTNAAALASAVSAGANS
jgi:hypothetical protein